MLPAIRRRPLRKCLRFLPDYRISGAFLRPNRFGHSRKIDTHTHLVSNRFVFCGQAFEGRLL